MSRWPEPPTHLEPGHAYGVLKIRRGSRLTNSVRACVDLDTCEVKMVDYLSRDAYDLGDNTLEFTPYGGKEGYVVIEGDNYELEMDPADTENSSECWARFQTKRLSEHIQKTPRAAPRRNPRM